MCYTGRVRYWRELPEPERQRALAEAEKYFASFPLAPAGYRQPAGNDARNLRRQAEHDVLEKFDLPSNFSARAREGLIASLIAAAINEQQTGESYPDARLADFHALLLKES